LIVGVFPVVAVTLVLHNIKLSHNLRVAGEISNLLTAKPTSSQAEETVVILADNKKDKVKVELSNLLYIESVGNYIQVIYYQDNKVVKTLLRGTIKRIESETVQYPSLVKCHRAFIVNVNHIESAKGNSQELMLALKNIDVEIPVSRNHAQKFKNTLR
ncbi:MAG: LytTR family DNA-binding domain-containing protein, partial [Tenuifilaceae bacterium]|nr:LytTR family DNA-binding domain-containing protein [Tenuifilaceae bacterium]